MPSHVSIVPETSSDTQSITMTAGEAITKDQLLYLTRSKKVFPAKATIPASQYLTRNSDIPIVVSETPIPLAANYASNADQAAVDRTCILSNGNIVIPYRGNEATPNYYVGIYTPDGILVARPLYYTTGRNLGVYVRKVDETRFAVIWLLDDSTGTELQSYRFMIFNNDGTVAQAVIYVTLGSGYVRNNQTAQTPLAYEFTVTSDGYIVAGITVSSTFYLVSWSLAGVVRATANSFMNFGSQKPELVEIAGSTICKVYDASNGISRVWKFIHTVNGNTVPDLVFSFSAPSPTQADRTTIIKFKTGVLFAERVNSGPYVVYYDGVTATQLLVGSTFVTTADRPTIHDIGDGEAIALFPIGSSGSFYAVRIDQTLKIRSSGEMNVAFLGGSSYGWMNTKVVRTPDALALVFGDYNTNGSPAGFLTRVASMALDWPSAGDLTSSLGTIVALTTNAPAQMVQSRAYYAQGEFRIIQPSEAGNYSQTFKIINIRRSGIIGVAAADAAKDAPVVIKTKGVFSLPSVQDFGIGFSFGASTQGVTATGGRVVGKNAILTGLIG